MSADEARSWNATELLKQANESLDSAASEEAAGRLRFAMNRVYYACFYAASAALLVEGRHFAKHTGVRASLHAHLVRTGRLSKEMGAFYDTAFQERLRADYGPMSDVSRAAVVQAIAQAREFVRRMRALIGA